MSLIRFNFINEKGPVQGLFLVINNSSLSVVKTTASYHSKKIFFFAHPNKTCPLPLPNSLQQPFNPQRNAGVCLATGLQAAGAEQRCERQKTEPNQLSVDLSRKP